MRSMRSLFVVGLTRLSSKESKAALLRSDMGIARMMIHVQQVEMDKLRDREEFKNKRVKTSGNESRKQKSIVNLSSFQHKQRIHAPSSASAPAPTNKCEYNSQNTHYFIDRPAHSQGSKTQGGTKTDACAKCRDGSTSCFMRECPKSRKSNGNGGNRA
uniref:Gag-pol polyprotein n=1 Tax=Solanum tuberosum TaxID=4113 RepID=M1DNP7_SOLTU